MMKITYEKTGVDGYYTLKAETDEERIILDSLSASLIDNYSVKWSASVENNGGTQSLRFLVTPSIPEHERKELRDIIDKESSQKTSNPQ